MRCDARKPSEELLDGSARLQVLEKRLDWHPSSLKDPRTTDLTFYSLDFWAITPIQHEVHGILAVCTRHANQLQS